jgi:hypothetical protein
MWVIGMRTAGLEMQIFKGLKSIAYAGLWLAIAVLVSACNSGSLSDGLQSAARPQPSQNLNNPTATAPVGGQSTLDATTQPTDPTANPQVAALPQGKAIAFLPVSNAPQTAVTNLARSIRNSATANGVPVVASVQQGAQYQVKGYFSALEDGSGTLLVYVWDVLDRNNKRVYRINGQEQSSSRSSDPWGAVTPDMLQRVADTTVTQLKSWLSSQ